MAPVASISLCASNRAYVRRLFEVLRLWQHEGSRTNEVASGDDGHSRCMPHTMVRGRTASCILWPTQILGPVVLQVLALGYLGEWEV